MSKALKLFLIVAVLFVTSGAAQAQYGIGRFERVQILADELEETTRMLYFQQERERPRVRGDVQILRSFYRLHNLAANFENQVQRNFNNRERLDLEYRRLASAARETEYMFNNHRLFGRGYLYRDFQVVSNMVNELGRALYSRGNRYGHGDRDRYDRDRDYDDNDDYDDDDYDDDDDEYDDD